MISYRLLALSGFWSTIRTLTLISVGSVSALVAVASVSTFIALTGLAIVSAVAVGGSGRIDSHQLRK